MLLQAIAVSPTLQCCTRRSRVESLQMVTLSATAAWRSDSSHQCNPHAVPWHAVHDLQDSSNTKPWWSLSLHTLHCTALHCTALHDHVPLHHRRHCTLYFTVHSGPHSILNFTTTPNSTPPSLPLPPLLHPLLFALSLFQVCAACLSASASAAAAAACLSAASPAARSLACRSCDRSSARKASSSLAGSE